ncbi:MAG: InlB B-repeat-containing protein, partial [Bacteroidaceae bacterium]|nr:InlB B-repeat-containing protein [Bacteroidaceae bacterium]
VQTYLYFDKNADDAVDGATTETTVYIGDEIIPALTTDEPTRDGYIFAGWRADAEGNAIAAGTTITAAGATVYAAWVSEEVDVLGYRFEAPKNWYLVNETLSDDYTLYRILVDGTEQPIDKSLYTVGALPTTDAVDYADCLGWHTLDVYFDDTAYGNVYETTFDAFVVPDKLILEEESPLDRREPTNLDKEYRDFVVSGLTMDVLFNLKDEVGVEALEAEFINEYFVNYFTTPDDIDVDVRVVTVNGDEYTSNFVGTGAIVQLVINGTVYDQVQVIVYGDVAGARADGVIVGDGKVNQTDIDTVNRYRNGKVALLSFNYLAGDVYSNAELNQSDADAINRYRNGQIALHPEWVNASHEYSRDYTARFGNLSVTE